MPWSPISDKLKSWAPILQVCASLNILRNVPMNHLVYYQVRRTRLCFLWGEWRHVWFGLICSQLWMQWKLSESILNSKSIVSCTAVTLMFHIWGIFMCCLMLQCIPWRCTCICPSLPDKRSCRVPRKSLPSCVHFTQVQLGCVYHWVILRYSTSCLCLIISQKKCLNNRPEFDRIVKMYLFSQTQNKPSYIKACRF